jgi:hypothetical protein
MAAFWYRFLVDIKANEMERNTKLRGLSVRDIAVKLKRYCNPPKN